MEKFRKLYSKKPTIREPFDTDMVKYLRTISATDTTLVSYYVKPNTNAAQHIKQEISKTKKIKSKTTRDKVTDALNKILSSIIVSEMGQALFSDGEHVWSVSSEYPINTSFYLCEKYFDLDYFDTINNNADIMLLVCLSNPFNLWEYQHGLFKLVKSIENMIPKKHKKGGQSAKRFEGIRNSEIEKAGNIVYDSTLGYSRVIYIGSENLFIRMISKRDPNAIFRKCQYCSTNEMYDIISEFDNSMQWERDIISCLFEMLALSYDKIDYGRKQCENAIAMNNVEFLITDYNNKDINYEKIILYGNTDQHQMFSSLGGVFVLLKYSAIYYAEDSDSIEVTY